jgi:hypothetical protein
LTTNGRTIPLMSNIARFGSTIELHILQGNGVDADHRAKSHRRALSYRACDPKVNCLAAQGPLCERTGVVACFHAKSSEVTQKNRRWELASGVCSERDDVRVLFATRPAYSIGD